MGEEDLDPETEGAAGARCLRTCWLHRDRDLGDLTTDELWRTHRHDVRHRRNRKVAVDANEAARLEGGAFLGGAGGPHMVCLNGADSTTDADADHRASQAQE